MTVKRSLAHRVSGMRRIMALGVALLGSIAVAIAAQDATSSPDSDHKGA